MSCPGDTIFYENFNVAIFEIQSHCYILIFTCQYCRTLKTILANQQEIFESHRKFRPKSWKICPFTFKSNILDYWIILTLEKCRIRLLWKSSSEKHPNYVAKELQSHRKSHVKFTALLSRSAGSNKKKDTLCRSNSHLYYSELQDSGSFNMSGCGHNQ